MHPKARIRHYEEAIAQYEEAIAAFREAIDLAAKEDAGALHLVSYRARKHRNEADRLIAIAEQSEAPPLAERIAEREEKSTKLAFGKLTVFTVGVIAVVLLAIIAGTTGDLSKTWKVEDAGEFAKSVQYPRETK